jgi:hypothetical protein
VGGYAVIFHAQPRFTKDIDVFIKADSANAQATYAALADFGAQLQGIRPEDFAERGSFFRFRRDPRGFDILPDIPGVDFASAWERRVEGVLDMATGLKAFSFRRMILSPPNFLQGDPKTSPTLTQCGKRQRTKTWDLQKMSHRKRSQAAIASSPQATRRRCRYVT